jgi:hypothetical protein
LSLAVLLTWLASQQIASLDATMPFLKDHWIDVAMFCGALVIVGVRRLWLDTIYIALMIAVTVHGAVTIALG